MKFPFFETQRQHIALSLDLYDLTFNIMSEKVPRRS